MVTDGIYQNLSKFSGASAATSTNIQNKHPPGIDYWEQCARIFRTWSATSAALYRQNKMAANAFSPRIFNPKSALRLAMSCGHRRQSQGWIERCSKWLMYFTILPWCFHKSFRGVFRDHTSGFRAMNIWQDCFCGAFAVYGKFVRWKQPVIHVCIWYDMSLFEIGLSFTFAQLPRPCLSICRRPLAQLSRAGFSLSRGLPILSPSKVLYLRVSNAAQL